MSNPQCSRQLAVQQPCFRKAAAGVNVPCKVLQLPASAGCELPHSWWDPACSTTPPASTHGSKHWRLQQLR